LREKEFKGTGDIPSGFSLRLFLFAEKKKEPKLDLKGAKHL